MANFRNGAGFHIRVNLYIIRFLYCYMDSESEPNLTKDIKKRRARYHIHEKNYFPSRQRMDRICKGESFEFSNKEAETLGKLFVIDENYFTANSSEPFHIQDIATIDWVCLYKKEYKVDDARIENFSKEEITKSYDRVQKALKRIVRNWNKLSYANPLFRICYYFYYDTAFLDKIKSTDTLCSLLDSIPYSAWDKENLDYLRSTYKLLKNHLDYIHCKLELHRLNTERAVSPPRNLNYFSLPFLHF